MKIELLHRLVIMDGCKPQSRFLSTWLHHCNSKISKSSIFLFVCFFPWRVYTFTLDGTCRHV